MNAVQLALVLIEAPPGPDLTPEERRAALRVLLAECRAIGRQRRRERRQHLAR